MDQVVAVFSIVGGIASVVMAVAAVAALTLWRRQIAGASQHELAKNVSGVLRHAAIARNDIIGALRSIESNTDETDLNRFLSRLLAPDVLRRSIPVLGEAVKAIEALEGQIAVLWGEAVLGLIEVVRDDCKGLFVRAGVELDPNPKERRVGYASYSMPSVAPSYTGRAFERALDLYTQLAQEWLAVHVGRDGARAMGADELAARRKQIEDEVARLAEPERIARERQGAELLARFREQPAEDPGTTEDAPKQ